MFSALLVALLGLGFTSKPVASCNTVINEVKELCGFYKYTTLDALEQKHAAQIITRFGSLFSSQCSTFSRILVCSRFVPFCFPPHHYLQPCRQLCQEVKSSCIHLFKKLGTPWPVAMNCSTLPSSPDLCLSPSSQTAPVFLLPSPMSSMYLPSVFSPPSPHRHLSFSSIKPTASMHSSSTSASSSSTPATSSHSTVHLQSRPTITPQSTSQGLILGISLMFAVFILLLPLVLYSLSRRFCPLYQPPTRNQDTITHIPLQQFPASEPTPSLPSPPPPPLPAKNKDIHIYENTKGTTLYAVSDLF